MIKEIPYDGLSIGNHELSSSGATVDYLADNFRSHWNGQYDFFVVIFYPFIFVIQLPWLECCTHGFFKNTNR